MTMVRGVWIKESPCCGARYSFPRYMSMNFSAFEYWTDGWREHSLMPNDEGLRRCQCGQYLLVGDLVQIGTADAAELPFMDRVPDAQLSECIAQVRSDKLEVAARLGYWRYLNHAYREQYRQHRDAEEAGIKARWEAANPDDRTWWDKFRGRKALSYSRPPGSPFTYPAFEATDEQLQNMQRLSDIFQAWGTTSQPWYTMELAELYREQGRFDEAERVLQNLEDQEDDVVRNLMHQLIKERQTAPVRYMV